MIIIDEVQILCKLLNEVSHAKVMLDVGALNGGASKPFLEKAWTVYAFEPNQLCRPRLIELQKKYSLFHLDSRAISEKTVKDVPFYTSTESKGISSLLNFRESHERTSFVDTITLDDFTRENNILEVDFLKIDAEGLDFQVLKGFPWERLYPYIVISEFEDRKTSLLGYSSKDMGNFLLSKGYKILVSEWYPIEKYGTQHSWKRFTPFSCEVTDNSSWGNFIAYREPIRLEDIFTSAMYEIAGKDKNKSLNSFVSRVKKKLGLV